MTLNTEDITITRILPDDVIVLTFVPGTDPEHARREKEYIRSTYFPNNKVMSLVDSELSVVRSDQGERRSDETR